MTSTRTTATRSPASSTTACPTAVNARLPAARTVTAQRGSSRSRASDSRRSASASTSSRGPRRTAVETGIACGSPAPVDSTATVPAGQEGSSSMPARLAAVEARGLFLQQPVRAFELLVGGLVDRRRADLAIDARVDDAVLLAGLAGDRADQRAALRPQALA